MTKYVMMDKFIHHWWKMNILVWTLSMTIVWYVILWSSLQFIIHISWLMFMWHPWQWKDLGFKICLKTLKIFGFEKRGNSSLGRRAMWRNKKLESHNPLGPYLDIFQQILIEGWCEKRVLDCPIMLQCLPKRCQT